jgi:hypothetical protein
MGSNHDEGTIFNYLPTNLTTAELVDGIQRTFGHYTDEVLSLVRRQCALSCAVPLCPQF